MVQSVVLLDRVVPWRRCEWIWLTSSILFIISLLVMLTCLFVIVLPRIYVRNFEVSKCTGVDVIWNKQYTPSCSCGQNCESQFPCVDVFASYTDNYGKNHDRVRIYRNQEGMKLYSSCSVQPDPCSVNLEFNKDFVDDFVERYGKGQVYQCFYNPENLKEVIVFRDTNYLPSLLWPSLCVVVFFVLSAISCKPCLKAVRLRRELRREPGLAYVQESSEIDYNEGYQESECSDSGGSEFKYRRSKSI